MTDNKIDIDPACLQKSYILTFSVIPSLPYLPICHENKVPFNTKFNMKFAM
jgi:hypothetical protein